MKNALLEAIDRRAELYRIINFSLVEQVKSLAGLELGEVLLHFVLNIGKANEMIMTMPLGSSSACLNFGIWMVFLVPGCCNGL